jgi:pyruvate ferredoxin oxidoreductase alpha subunit
MHLASRNALSVYEEAAADFARIFGRSRGVVDLYRMDEADLVLVMAGSFATKARAAIDQMREEGKRVGLLRLRLLRPWPACAIAAALAGRRGVAVIDQNLAPGHGGILYQEVAAALLPRSDRPALVRSFVGGLGGKDISPAEFRHVIESLERGDSVESAEVPELLYTEAEWRQVDALTRIAGATVPQTEGRS